MPLFVKKAALDRLQSSLDYYKGRAAELDRLEPFIPAARLLREETERLVDNPNIPAEAIGELAFINVLQAEVARARRERAAEYERAHRKELYARVLEEVDAHEGPALLEGVMQRLDTDAALVAELRKEARKEVVARAIGIATEKVTAEQEAAIQDEIKRQMALDRFDVAFAVSGETDLHDERLTDLLAPGDRLEVLFSKDNAGQTGVGFYWRQDINKALGWVMDKEVIKSEHDYYRKDTRVDTGTAPRDRFVSLGSQMPDYTKGKSGVRADVIVADYPLAILWETVRGNSESYPVRVSIHDTQYGPNSPLATPNVSAIDFQARELVFASAD